MRLRLLKYFISVGIATILAVPIFSFAVDVPINTTAHVYFSPDGGCTQAIIQDGQKFY